ncbi:NgoFVII restriction endonuclease [Microbacteriaceae bacterium MWH-Ta3]|nr:NgoFVII restriction endonuclease [Microbacteriaceae bacterium MWH-Ta3]
MELLSSEFTPSKFGVNTFTHKWERLFGESSEVRICVGYISEESVNLLLKLVDSYPEKHLDLCIGMAQFDGLSKSQIRILGDLHTNLKTRGKGGVYIVQTFPFHGKIHMFTNTLSSLRTAILGSSNLSNIIRQEGIFRGNFEVDVYIDEASITDQLTKLCDSLVNHASVEYDHAVDGIPIINSTSMNALDEVREVQKIEPSTLEAIFRSATNIRFEIPIKTEERSSLNVYFGKGRAGNGIVRPRLWYEAALIVDKSVIQSSAGYPTFRSFWAYTDDGYRILMRTGGGNSKNLESAGDLSIFGRWIKGRMEAEGALDMGSKVTSEVLSKYGNKLLTLVKLDLQEMSPDGQQLLEVWAISFAPGKD